ncbi:Putative_vacuolar sorting-associated protein 13 [Hexamita inflata]|uniref:Vacuolar sorting-associated protein 13 n=1 Tax=Hexamita inflata TaxID=28002 RepID=A0AA86Q1C0_9EUKA|nr:Putative vacuolar sorting-associated protein 13 [Hexamita inflata]
MLEEVIANLISDFSDKYLEDFDSNQLSITLTKGDIQVSNLSINPNALRDIHPALCIKRGTIGNMKIKINYFRIKSDPVVIILDDILLLAQSKEQHELSKEDIAKRIQQAFISKMQNCLSTQIICEDSLSEKKKGKMSKYMLGLTQAILNNIKIQITNFHVRFEDPDVQCAMGVTIKQILVQSVDQHGKETTFKEDELLITKEAQLIDFAVYCDTHYVPLIECTKPQQMAFLKQTIATQTNSTPFNYLIKPMSVRALYKNDKNPGSSLTGAQNQLKIIVSNLNFNISSAQINAILRTIQKLSQFGSQQKKIENRPGVKVEENAFQWLRYVFSSFKEKEELNNEMLEQFEMKAYMRLFTQHYINSNTKEGLQQIEQYKKAYEEKKETHKYMFCRQYPCMCDSEDGNKMMQAMHKLLKSEQITICRMLVIKQLYKKSFKDLKKTNYQFDTNDHQIAQLINDEKEELQKQKENEKFPEHLLQMDFSVQFDNIQIQINSTEKTKEDPLIMTVNVPVNPTAAASKSKFFASKIETVKETLPHGVGSTSHVNPIVQLNLKLVEVQFALQFSGVITIGAKVSTLDVLNLFKSGEFPLIIRKVPNNMHHILDSLQKSDYTDDPENKQLDLQFVKHSSTLATLKMTIKPVSVVATPDLIKIFELISKESLEIVKETKENKYINNLIDKADVKWAELKTLSQKTIQETIANHFRINVDITMQAPVLLVPVQCSQTIFVCNLGMLKIHSNMIDYNPQIKSSEECYDIYSAELTNVFIFIVQTHSDVGRIFSSQQQNMLDDFFERHVLLKPATIQTEVKHCFVKNHIQAERTVVKINIKRIFCNVSEQNTNALVQLFEYLVNSVELPVKQKKVAAAPIEMSDESSAKQFQKQVKLLNAIANDLSIQDGTTGEESSTTDLSDGSILQKFSMIGEHSKEEVAKYVKLRFEFKLESIAIQVYGTSTRTQQDQLISSVSLANVSLQFVDYPYSKHAEISIYQLKMIDNVENTIILNSPDNQLLLNLQYNKTNSRHPSYRNINQQLDLDMCGIHLQYDPQYIKDMTVYAGLKAKQVKQFIKKQDEQEVTKKHHEQNIDLNVAEKATRKLITQQNQKTLKITESIMKFKVYVKLGDCSITLKKQNCKESLSTFTFQQSVLHYIKYEKVQAIHFQTQGFKVVDYYKNTIHKNVIQTPSSAEGGIEMNLFLISPSSNDFCGYKQELDIQVKTQIQFTIMLRYLMQLASYFKTEKEELDIENTMQISFKNRQNTLIDNVKQQAEEVTTKYKIPSLRRMNIQIKVPSISIPLNDNSTEQIILDLGNLNVKTSYHVGSPGNSNDRDFAQNIPMSNTEVNLLDTTIYLYKPENEYNDKTTILQPNCIQLLVSQPLLCESTEQAKLSGILPGLYLGVKFKDTIDVKVGVDQFDFIISMLKPCNNLGYDEIDEIEIDDQKMKKLKQQLLQMKQQLQQEGKTSDDIKQQLKMLKATETQYSQKQQKAKSLDDLLENKKKNKTKVLSNQATSQFTSEMMKIAIFVNVPGLQATLLGGRNTEHQPVNCKQRCVEISISTFQVDLKMYMNSFRLNASLKQIQIQDLRNSSYADKYKYMLKTDGEIQFLVTKSVEGCNEIKINCAREIKTNLIIVTLFYLKEYFSAPYDAHAMQTRKHRQRKYDAKQKLKDLKEHINQLEKLKQSDTHSFGTIRTSVNYENVVNSTKVNDKTKMRLNLPHFEINIPLDPTDELSQVLQMQMEFYTDLEINNNGIEKLTADELGLEQYEVKQILTISPQIYGLLLQIVTDETQEMLLQSMDILVDVTKIVSDTLVSTDKSSIIKREQDVLIKSLVSNAIAFKLTGTDLDFFMQIIQQVKQNSTIQQDYNDIDEFDPLTNQTETLDNSVTNLLDKSDHTDIFSTSQNQVIDIDPAFYDNILLKDAKYIQTVKYASFEIFTFMNRNDIKIQADFTQGIQFSLIDDKRTLRPLLELKLPTLMMEGTFVNINNSGIPTKNFVATFTLVCNAYAQRLFDWEPLIENVAITFTYSYDAVLNPLDSTYQNQSTIILKTMGNFQMNITPGVIMVVQNAIEIIQQLTAKKQVEYPLLYQKLNEEEANLMDKSDLQSVRSSGTSIEKMQQFKQLHICNKTSCSVQVSSMDEVTTHCVVQAQTDEYLDIDHNQLLVTLNIFDDIDQQMFKFYATEIGKHGIQYFTLGQQTIFMDVSMHDRQLYILFRPRIMLINKTSMNLYISVDEGIMEMPVNEDYFIVARQETTNIYILTNMKQQISTACGICFKQQIPAFVQSNRQFMRVQTKKQSTSVGDVLDISFWPTYQIKNDCLKQIYFEEDAILPGQIHSFYTNPMQDFNLGLIGLQKYEASNVNLAKIIAKVPKDKSVQTQVLQQEASQTKILYQFAQEITLTDKKNKQQVHLGIHRHFKLEPKVHNQFLHLLIVYPYMIMRNLLATHNHSFLYDSAKVQIQNPAKQKSKFIIECPLGEAVHTSLVNTDQLEICLDYDNLKFQSQPISTQVTHLTIPCATEKLKFTCELELAQNKLSKVLSFYPSRIIRNFTKNGLRVFLTNSNQFSVNAKSLKVNPDAPMSCLFNGSFIFIQGADEQLSSAIQLDDSVNVVRSSGLNVSVQISQSKFIQYIDIFDESFVQYEIYNHTDQTVYIEQVLQLEKISSKSKQLPPSIAHSANKQFTCAPSKKMSLYASDLSLTPVFCVKYLDEEINLSMNKLGRRKPKQINNQLIFTQVDCQSNRKIIEISNTPLKRVSVASLVATNSRLQVQNNFSVEIQHVSISLFETVGTFQVHNAQNNKMQTVSNIPVELFALELDSIILQNLKLEETEAFQVQVREIKLMNMQPQANNRNILEIDASQGTALLLQAERLHKSQFYTMISAQWGNLILNIDQCFYESGFAYFKQFSKMQLESVSYNPAIIDAAVIKYLLPATPTQPKPVLDKSLFYIGFLQIQEVQAIVSFAITDISQSGSSLVYTLFNTFSTSLAQIQNAKIHLQRLIRQNILTQKKTLLYQLGDFYKKQFLQNIGSILKSAFLIGSISEASQGFGDSMADMMDSQNAQQRLKGFQNLGKSALSGYLSVISSATTLVSGVAANLTFDKDYTLRRQKQLRESKKDSGMAAANAFTSLGTGLFEGITGIFVQPIQGGMEEGVAGVFKGIGKGISGVFMKPVAGVVDFFSHMSLAAQTGMQQKAAAERAQRVFAGGVIGK